MKVHQELNLKLKKVSDHEFMEIIKEFTQKFNEWNYLENESLEHTKETTKPSCILFLDDDYHKPEFLITKRKDNLYSIYIYNSQYGYIPMLEYNALLRKFSEDFKTVSNPDIISAKISKEEIGLQEIISSDKARDLFEKYLSFHPRSYHINDKERLYFFISAASRCKKRINTELLKRYLVEDLNWSEEDANWCRETVDLGLEILKAHKQMYLFPIRKLS
ncbi:MAG TPA: hypothetical protein VK203_29510 [Nostocaceae cyanobacterium]|nr:hypothetical protein [Nostocaceae cyanobacterium]